MAQKQKKKMKAESAIRRQIARIERVWTTTNSEMLRGEAYEAYHALRWVLGGVDWVPAKMFEQRLAEEKASNG